MSVRVSGKHMEIGESFRQKIEDQIGMAITKYFDGGYSGQVTVEGWLRPDNHADRNAGGNRRADF